MSRQCRVGAAAVVVCALWGSVVARPPAVQDPTLSERLDAYVSAIGAFGFSGAVVVARGDEVLVRRACGMADRAAAAPNTPETIFDIGSVTKSFTAAAIVKLETAGRLGVHDRISAHLRGVPEDKTGVTIHHLLTHTSGLPRGVAMAGEAAHDRGAAVRAMLALPLESAPGARWSYSNTGYQLLACVIEEVTGERFEDHLRANLFEPAGMRRTGFIGEEGMAREAVATGYSGDVPGGVVGRADGQWYHWGLRGCGGILASIDDLLLWERALRAGTVLSKAEQEKVFTPHQPSHGPGWSYGYGWEIADSFLEIPGRFMGHGGDTRGFECKYYRFPDDDLSIMVVSNTNDHHAWWIPNQLISIVFGRPYAAPPVVAPQDGGTLRALAGEYAAESGGVLSVRVNGGALSVMPEGQEVITVFVPAPWGGDAPGMYDDFNRRADEVFDALAARDLRALDAILDPQWPDWAGRLTAWLDREAAARGKIHAHRVLGTTEDFTGLRTWVQIQFANGPELARLGWNGERITMFEFPSPDSPGRIFVPGSATRFSAFDIATGRVVVLEFTGGPADLRATLRSPDGRALEFRRRGGGAAGRE